MKVGDLVRYKGNGHCLGNGMWDWGKCLGLVVRQIPGTDELQVVEWTDGVSNVGYPKRQLELVNESR